MDTIPIGYAPVARICVMPLLESVNNLRGHFHPCPLQASAAPSNTSHLRYEEGSQPASEPDDRPSVGLSVEDGCALTRAIAPKDLQVSRSPGLSSGLSLSCLLDIGFFCFGEFLSFALITPFLHFKTLRNERWGSLSMLAFLLRFLYFLDLQLQVFSSSWDPIDACVRILAGVLNPPSLDSARGCSCTPSSLQGLQASPKLVKSTSRIWHYLPWWPLRM